MSPCTRYAPLVFFTLLFLSQLSAQGNFREAYFIDRRGNRVEVRIQLKNPTIIQQEILYRRPDSERTETANVDDLEEYGFRDGGRYVRRTVRFDESRDDQIRYLSTDPNPLFETQTLFLEPLFTGDLTLYRFKDARFVRFWIQEADGPIEPLVYKRFRLPGTGEAKAGENAAFRKVLKDEYAYPDMEFEELLTMKYREKPIRTHFERYAAARGLSITPVEQLRPKIKYSIAATFGATYQNHVVDSRNRSYDFAAHSTLLPGFELELNFPGNNYGWSLLFDGFFQDFNLTSESELRSVEITQFNVPLLHARRYFGLGKSGKVFLGARYGIGVMRETLSTPFQELGTDQGGTTSFHYYLGYEFKERFSLLSGRFAQVHTLDFPVSSASDGFFLRGAYKFKL